MDKTDAVGVPLDPAWRLSAYLLPVGATVAVVLTAAQTLNATLDRAAGVAAALTLCALSLVLWRDLRRRAAADDWLRREVSAFLAPLGLFLVLLFLLLHGAALPTLAPLLFVLLPVAWQVVHLPPVQRRERLWPFALPMVGDEPTPVSDGAVEAIVRVVLDGLPPDIQERLTGWTVEVQEELRPQTPGYIVYGLCTPATQTISIYRHPHLFMRSDGKTLDESVTYTVLHEIGHALGLDEHGVRRLGWLQTPLESLGT